MRNAIALFALFASLTLAGQQRRILIGGGDPDAAKDWPKPQIRAGLTQEQTLAAIADYGQTLAGTDHFSGSLLVAKDGKPLLSRAWGMAGPTEKNTVDTKFNIGSINKIFTKTAIDGLVKEGKLSLDDTIRQRLPDYPSPAAGRITIQQLLDHRSGLGDIFGPKYQSAPPSRLRELSDFLPLFADQPLEFEPGTSQRYSNAGYIVLGLIIERVSGQKYRDYIQQHVFAPAGMTNSGFWTVDENVPNRAVGYTMRGPEGPLTKRADNRSTLPGRPSSAGGAYSTAGDLLRFIQWLHAGRLGIGGGAPGLNASIEVDDGWAVIAMSNYDPPSAEELARGTMQIIRGRVEERVGGGAPLAKDDHLFTVEAKINGKGPYHFAVDSGSARALRVSPELAKELSLEQVGEAMSSDPSGKNAMRRPVVRVGTVEVGGQRFEGIDATVGGRAEPGQSDGVIGLALFTGMTVTLDYPRHELRLSREPLPADGPHVIPFTASHGVPQIEVDLAGVKLVADVDTGSPALFNLPPSMKVPFTAEPRVVGHGRTVSNEFEIRAAEVRGDLHVAGWTHANPTVDIVDLFPMANVGSRFLRQYVVSFDMANKRFALAK